jgi:glycine/D-amino acid oxidase-like deaminating enzyme
MLPTIIIGGGVNGLAFANALKRAAPSREVVLLERRRVGHARASSHGASRIKRGVYGDPLWTALMARADRVDWPDLERACGRRLLHPTPAFLFGSERGPFARYAASAQAVPGLAVKLLTAAEARRLAPLRFDDVAGVLEDDTAALIAAEETVAALSRLARDAGVRFLEGRRALALDRSRDPIRIETDQGPLDASEVAVVAGPWTAELVPELRRELTVIRQTVGYFALDCPEEEHGLGRFPIWARLESGENEIHYGLPAFGRPG